MSLREARIYIGLRLLWSVFIWPYRGAWSLTRDPRYYIIEMMFDLMFHFPLSLVILTRTHLRNTPLYGSLESRRPQSVPTWLAARISGLIVRYSSLELVDWLQRPSLQPQTDGIDFEEGAFLATAPGF